MSMFFVGSVQFSIVKFVLFAQLGHACPYIRALI